MISRIYQQYGISYKLCELAPRVETRGDTKCSVNELKNLWIGDESKQSSLVSLSWNLSRILGVCHDRCQPHSDVANAEGEIATLDLISGERLCHFFVHSAYGDFPLRCVSLHFFVLGKFDRAGSLVFRRPARNCLLHGVAQLHQDLTKTMESLSRFLRILRNRAVAWDKNVGGQRFNRIQRFQPAKTVAIVYVEKLIGKKQLAHIGDPILRDEYNAVAPSMTATQIENLNFLAAEVNRQAIPIGYLRESGHLVFQRDTIALH